MRRIICILCLVLVISMLSTPVAAQSHGEAYEHLSSEAFQEAYRLLEEGIAGMAPVIHFPAELEIHYNELLDIARAVCLDHPEYFWFLESWFYEFDREGGRYLIDTITPTYYLDHERVSAGSQALADAMIAFRSKVDEIITGIPVNCTSDYDIALYLHDYLAEHVRYTLEGDHDSAYAALIHGEAACYGYSKAYQYLLNQAGVRSRIIVGDSPDEEGNLTGHAWNQVWIDGECYYTDVTWDDMESWTTHQYFMISLEEISADHIADEMFELPACGHSLDFYQVSAGKGVATISDSTTGKTAAEHFQMVSLAEDVAVFNCDARIETDVGAWLDANAIDLINTLGISYDTEISYYYSEDVYFLILTDPAYVPTYRKANEVSLNFTEVMLKGAGAQVQLDAQVTPFAAGVRLPVYTSEDESVAVVSSGGMVTAVGPGSTVITVTSADGMATAQCTVTVEAGDAHIHSLRLIGASDPTCTLDGNAPYYLCTGCFHRFADQEAAQELTDVSAYAQLATGHVDVTWQPKKNTNSHHQVCICGVTIPQTTGPHKDLDEDGLCDSCGAQMAVKTQEDQSGAGGDQSEIDYVTVSLIGAGVLAAAVVVVVLVRRRY